MPTIPSRRLAPRPARILASAGLLIAAVPVTARAAAPPAVAVSRGEILLVPGSPALGFFTIANNSDTALLMTGWSTPACGTLQFEEAGAEAGGISRVTVPGRNRLVFTPGGYHLTCWRPKAGLRAGAAVPVTIAFRGGATVTAPFRVRVPTPLER